MPSYPPAHPEFQPGDTVTVRSWDDMLSQYGTNNEGIKTPYVTFFDSMKPYCGNSYKIRSVRLSIDGSRWIYILESCDYHPFTVNMFATATSVPPTSLSFDDLLKGVF